MRSGGTVLWAFAPLRGLLGDDAPETVDDREVRKRIRQANRELESAGDDVEDLKETYLELLKMGARHPEAHHRRRILAIKARFAKFKMKVQELRRLKALKQLARWTVQHETAAVEEMLGEMEVAESPAVQSALADPAELQENVDDLVAHIDDEMATVGAVMEDVGNLDVDNAARIPTHEEEALMNHLADGGDVEDVTPDVNAVDRAPADAGPLDGADVTDIDVDLTDVGTAVDVTPDVPPGDADESPSPDPNGASPDDAPSDARTE